MESVKEIELAAVEEHPAALALPLEIERHSATELSYHQFFSRYMGANLAVIVTSVAEHWECYRRWICEGRLDVCYLKANIGNVTVPIADCAKRHYNSHEKSEMKFHEFLAGWGGEAGRSEARHYLKDWHLREAMPGYEFYETPAYFASDWLNEYLVDCGLDDYMFVYIGPKGTWTSFHADVFSSYSWSANIFGVKKWLLLPPKEELKLQDALGNLPFEVSEDLLDERQVKYYKIMQSAGEAIFVPSGWFHQVENVEDAVSVNHNWFNGCNISEIWKNIEHAYGQVVDEISDCRDMEDFDEHCQLMLKASHGMNFDDFLNLIIHICDKRVEALRSGKTIVHFGLYKLGQNHIRYDIGAVKSALTSMLVKADLLGKLNLLSKVEKYIELINRLDI